LLDGSDTDAAAEAVQRSFQPARDDPDDACVFWLSLAAAQAETGRLQESVKQKALDIIGLGGDVERWAAEDSALARRRQKALDRLADQLTGPQPKPKRLRRQKPLGQSFDLGDALLLRGRRSERRALALVVDHAEGAPRGTLNPVVELLAWDNSELPTREEMQTMPTVMRVNTLKPGSAPHPRSHLWLIYTARKDQVFGTDVGEIVARGVHRKPSGDHRHADALSEVGASATSWPTLCAYLDGEYVEDLRLTMEVSPRRRGIRSRLRRS
jgi:hypothetical protein